MTASEGPLGIIQFFRPTTLGELLWVLSGPTLPQPQWGRVPFDLPGRVQLKFDLPEGKTRSSPQYQRRPMQSAPSRQCAMRRLLPQPLQVSDHPASTQQSSSMHAKQGGHRLGEFNRSQDALFAVRGCCLRATLAHKYARLQLSMPAAAALPRHAIPRAPLSCRHPSRVIITRNSTAAAPRPSTQGEYDC
jgi:hypothetical protein